MTEPSSGYRERNSTADRALTILGLFAEDKLQVSAADVAEALGCARSTAYRYLQTLVRSAFLEEAPTGGFRLGIRVTELARLARRGYGLGDLALPIMRTLADSVTETVILTRLVDDAVVCIERCEGAGQLIRLSYERGSRLPINAGASALPLLAWLPTDRVRNLLEQSHLRQFTENTLTDVDALLARLATIRDAGYALTVAEVDPDAVGIAAPVFDEAGDVVMALSVVTTRRRAPEERRDSLVTAVTDAAQAISERVIAVGL